MSTARSFSLCSLPRPEERHHGHLRPADGDRGRPRPVHLRRTRDPARRVEVGLQAHRAGILDQPLPAPAVPGTGNACGN